MAKLHYHKQYCRNCGEKYDSVLAECPYCKTNNQDEEIARSWKECTPLGTGKEILCFLFGFAGLQVIQILVQIVVMAIVSKNYANEGLTGNELQNAVLRFLNTGQGLASIFFPAYALLFIGFIIILWKNLSRFFSRFANKKTYMGVLFVIGIYVFEVVYSFLTSPFTKGETNQNQGNVVSINRAYPILSILIFGLIGPFCEECTYRLGLVNLLKRWNTIASYLLSALLFGAIHFNWTNIGSAIEWLNLPPYIVSGLLFAIAYDKFGFGASYLAHALNNTLACVLSLIPIGETS